MKRITIALASLALCTLAFTSCKPSKAQLKKEIVKECNEGAAKQFTDPKLVGFMKDYCECSGEKAADKLSTQEFEEINKMKKEGREQEMQAKLMPIIQPCLNELQAKMQASMGGATQPQ